MPETDPTDTTAQAASPNSTTDQPTLAVIQADREAAALNIKRRLVWQHGGEQPWMDASTTSMRMGEQDHHDEVQAFARHRTHSEPRPVAGLREALQALRRWHRDSCYPEALDFELETGLAAILATLSPDPTSLEGGEGVVRPFSEWHEDHGDVLWWKLPILESPYVGSPIDLGRSMKVVVQVGFEEHDLPITMTGGWPFNEDDEATLYWSPLPDARAITAAVHPSTQLRPVAISEPRDDSRERPATPLTQGV